VIILPKTDFHLIEPVHSERDGFTMLTRARNFGIVALLAAVFGFTGLLQNSAPLAQWVFYLALGFTLISFVLCAFEEVPSKDLKDNSLQSTT